MDDREIVLSYKDVVLRVSDLNILKGPCYLNDQIIDFYFAYLSSSYSADANDILLVPPSTSYWFANCQDQQSLVNDFVEPLKFSSKKLILFTVNDNEDFSAAERGTHWSLLVYDRSQNYFLHFDSLPGMHRYHALKLYKAVKGFMGTASESSSKDGAKTLKMKAVGSAAVPFFKEAKTPQQTNGFDCGLYVMAIAEVICRWHSCERNGNDGDWLSVVEREVNANLETTMRGEVLKLIEDLRKQ
ncbi:NEDD8-specific protease 1 [Populus alba x Populus x berolinensis]|uniref:Ubiquitin-like protease family profile domain-containing protein n=1 Tax=Populus davidiana TaxID=266767 RepID=A0A6M2F6L2_9ROSI|nr:NEDD8-specific protease 1 [Populus alba x Populus x berolinensis]